ncbi:MAG: plastocyanin/azurin family copper-binding protein [Gemmatimonadales bacterium]
MMRKLAAALGALVALGACGGGGDGGGNGPATPTSFQLSGGDNQALPTNGQLAAPLSVKVLDQNGDGIAGITVDWSVLSGTVTLVGGATSVTAGTGVATKTVTGGATLGAAGVRASTTSVPGTNVDFTLTLFPAVVQVGDNFFRSLRNSSQDAAVDTVQVGQQVRWTVTGSASHTVESTGTPTFTSSGNLGKGSTYTITFGSAGTYTFDCAIHGAAQMSGRIVVVP